MTEGVSSSWEIELERKLERDINALASVLRRGGFDGARQEEKLRDLGIRIRAVLERAAPTDGESVDDSLLLDSNTREVRAGVRQVTFRRAEFHILRHLLLRRPAVVSQQELLSVVLGTCGRGSSVRNQIWEIRQKLVRSGLPATVETIRGVGYRANVLVQRVSMLPADAEATPRSSGSDEHLTAYLRRTS